MVGVRGTAGGRVRWVAEGAGGRGQQPAPAAATAAAHADERVLQQAAGDQGPGLGQRPARHQAQHGARARQGQLRRGRGGATWSCAGAAGRAWAAEACGSPACARTCSRYPSGRIPSPRPLVTGGIEASSSPSCEGGCPSVAIAAGGRSGRGWGGRVSCIVYCALLQSHLLVRNADQLTAWRSGTRCFSSKQHFSL